MEYYNAGVDACPPSAHAAETLAELSRQGWRQSVLSASRRDYLIEQVAARGLQGYFTELLGLADIYGVSKVQVGKQWLAQSGISPAACVMVGDTQHDAEVAKALGTKMRALHRRPPVPCAARGCVPKCHRRSGTAAAAAGSLIMYI